MASDNVAIRPTWQTPRAVRRLVAHWVTPMMRRSSSSACGELSTTTPATGGDTGIFTLDSGKFIVFYEKKTLTLLALLAVFKVIKGAPNIPDMVLNFHAGAPVRSPGHGHRREIGRQLWL